MLCRSSSSSKENGAFFDEGRMFPAPPRPLLNLDEVWGRPREKSEAGPWAVLPSVVLGALNVFPAPPRPEWMNEDVATWG